MDILVVSPTPSHPTNAGNRQALYHLGKYLRSAGYTTHFLYYADEEISAQSYDEMRRHWSYFYLFPRTKAPPAIGEIGVDDMYDSQLGLLAHLIVRTFNVRQVLVNYIFYSKLLEGLPAHITKIIHTHDRFGDRHELFRDNRIRQEMVSTSIAHEALALKRADKIIAVQDSEASYFTEISERPAYVLQQIFPNRFLPRRVVRAERFGYLGSLNTINAASVRELVTAFQALSGSFPGNVRLRIAGGVSGMVEDCADDRTHVVGPVSDVEEFYRNVDVVVNPMKFGTGLKIKTVEALSFGFPVLSTIEGTSGIEHDNEFLGARNVTTLVDMMLRVSMRSDMIISHQRYCRELFMRYAGQVNDALNTLFPSVNSRTAVPDDSDELVLAAYDFKENKGWFYLEGGPNPFRWSGPAAASEIDIAFEFTRYRRGALEVVNAMRAPQLADVRIVFGGVVLESEIVYGSECSGEIRFRVPAGLPRSGISSLKVVVPYTISPNAINPSASDTRRLGLAISQLTMSR